MRHIPLFLNLANLRRLTLAEFLCFLLNVFHNATDGQQRILSIDHADGFASAWIVKIYPSVEHIQGETCPWSLAIFFELFSHLPQMRQSTLVFALQNTQRSQSYDIGERVNP